MKSLFDHSLVKGGVIVMIGPPLVGKGTQSAMLGEFLGLPVVSSGDVFREVASSGSDLGKELDKIMSSGGLVPNELVLKVFVEYLSNPSFADGLILDGFVREKENLETLRLITEELGLKVLTFIYLKESSQEALVIRLQQRLDACKAEGITPRNDDKIEVFERRWKVYQEKTVDVLNLLSSDSSPYSMLTINAMDEESNGEVNYRTKTAVANDLQEQLIQFLFSTSKSLLNLARLLGNKLTELEESLPKYQSIPDQVMEELLSAYLQVSLQQNLDKRTGLTRRFIFLVSTNQHKFQEFVSIFDQYGIEVLVLPHELRRRYYPIFYRLLLAANASAVSTPKKIPSFEGVSLVAIFKEYTSLIRYYAMKTEDPQQYIRVEIRDGMKVVHLSQLDIFEYDAKTETVVNRTFSHKTPGSIDCSRRTAIFANQVFGWDDIFVVESTGWTYNQLKQLRLKVSSRDMNLSKWIQEKIYYKTLTDLKFTPIHASRSIDFSIDVYHDFLERHGYYNNPMAIQSGMISLFHNIINTGLYFRSPINRRLKNYWCPGLNAGIPLTPKKDEIHEATYLAHDLGHFGLPDLVFTGKTSPLHKLVYITWRMLSESLTMTIADMAFVDTLVKTGIPYAYEKRAIYPLFVDIDLPLVEDLSSESAPKGKLNLSHLKQIIYANFRYCLLGDDAAYRQLLQQAASRKQSSEVAMESLLKFEKKYEAFFIEDFKWTHFNYHNMCRKSDLIAVWWREIQPLLAGQSRMFYTIDEVLELLHLREIWYDGMSEEAEGEDQNKAREEQRVIHIIEIIFNYVVDQIIFPLFTPMAIQSKAYRLDRAFRRYLIGQCAIFAKYDFLAESKEYYHRILRLVPAPTSDKQIDLPLIEQIRSEYDQYLMLLYQKNLISWDDKLTYSESYPLFDPMYLSYDQDHSQQSLATVAREILMVKTPFSSYRDHKHDYYLRPNFPLSESEFQYLRIMHSLLEHSQAQVMDSVYVIEPGVILLSEIAGFEHPLNLLTFFIAGISIETSLELVAHKEAIVARLTTSKTNAMNLPLYRIFPYLHQHYHEPQMTLLQKQASYEIQSIRNQYQNQYDQIVAQRHIHDNETHHKEETDGDITLVMAKKDSQELLNLGNTGNKCTFLCYSMTIQDLHKLFIGRSGYDGNESEVREVIQKMHSIAYQRYPQLLWSWNRYLEANNRSKLDQRTAELVVPPITAGLQTSLTKEAKRLLHAMKINTQQPEYLQLADFRSRITYLSFAKKVPTEVEKVIAYHRKIIVDLGHSSVLGAYQMAVPDEKDVTKYRLITTKEALALALTGNSAETREYLKLLFP